jgi:hypothetical protein
VESYHSRRKRRLRRKREDVTRGNGKAEISFLEDLFSSVTPAPPCDVFPRAPRLLRFLYLRYAAKYPFRALILRSLPLARLTLISTFLHAPSVRLLVEM